MKKIIHKDDAEIQITEYSEKRHITVKPNRGQFIPIKNWETRYPVELIEKILELKGPAYLCDEIMRDEDPNYVEHSFYWDILSYVEKKDFSGRRILDFGSGSGASSIVLARMFPNSDIVGVELLPEYIEIAKERVKFHKLDDRVKFFLSPTANTLPKDLAEFDYIILSAVYEHLLPGERQVILKLLWTNLKQDGILFLNQTPYRWFPIEMHTTGLPFINYFPNKLALKYAQFFSKTVDQQSSWDELLRRGIRGATTKEIIDIIKETGDSPDLMIPTKNGVRDHIDLWFYLSSTTRMPIVKRVMRSAFRVVRFITGVNLIPTLSIAIRKT